MPWRVRADDGEALRAGANPPEIGRNWFPLGRKRLYGAAQGSPVRLDHL